MVAEQKRTVGLNKGAAAGGEKESSRPPYRGGRDPNPFRKGRGYSTASRKQPGDRFPQLPTLAANNWFLVGTIFDGGLSKGAFF